MAAILILSFTFDYLHHVFEAVVLDLWTFRVTASAEGYLSACTVFLKPLHQNRHPPTQNDNQCGDHV